MREYKSISTTVGVWGAIHKAHPELKVFENYSAPDGAYLGNHSQGKMFISFGFDSCEYPIISAQTTWDIDSNVPSNRLNEKHQYWLCLPIMEGN